MTLHEVAISSDYNGVAFVVCRKASIHATQVLPDFEWSVGRMLAVEAAIGGKDEEEIAIVASEVFVAEVVGELVVEMGPYCHVDIFPHCPEEVIE